MTRTIFTAAVVLMVSAAPVTAAMIYNFQIDTSSLAAGGGPYALDAFFIDGGDGTNNMAILTLAGGSPAAPLMDSFFSEQQLAFVPAGLLRFQLNITTNPDIGAFVSPDEFTVALLQNGTQVTTTDPTGGNALISVTLPTVVNGAPSVAFTDNAARTFRPGFAVVTAAPEPSTFFLTAIGFLGVLCLGRASVSRSARALVKATV